MSTRVSPLERIRADIDDLFASDRDLADVLEEVGRLGVCLLIQTAVESEIAEFLGRERYALGERARPGSNGHCPTTIKTTAGPITIGRPKLRGTDEAFALRPPGRWSLSHRRPGVPGHRRLHPRPVGPRRRGHPGGGPGFRRQRCRSRR